MISIPLFAKWNLRAGDERSRMIYRDLRLDACKIIISVIGLAELVYIVSMGAIVMVQATILIPAADAVLAAVCSLDTDVVFVEVLEKRF